MVMVGTKCEESARVVILFSCCCLWFFPITSPAVHELVRKVTMAEQIATMRYLMNAFIFGFIRFSCPLLTFRLLFLKEEREGALVIKRTFLNESLMSLLFNERDGKRIIDMIHKGNL